MPLAEGVTTRPQKRRKKPPPKVPFSDLPKREQQRRITLAEKAGRLTHERAQAARSFHDLAPRPTGRERKFDTQLAQAWAGSVAVARPGAAAPTRPRKGPPRPIRPEDVPLEDFASFAAPKPSRGAPSKRVGMEVARAANWARLAPVSREAQGMLARTRNRGLAEQVREIRTGIPEEIGFGKAAAWARAHPGSQPGFRERMERLDPRDLDLSDLERFDPQIGRDDLARFGGWVGRGARTVGQEAVEAPGALLDLVNPRVRVGPGGQIATNAPTAYEDLPFPKTSKAIGTTFGPTDLATALGAGELPEGGFGKAMIGLDVAALFPPFRAGKAVAGAVKAASTASKGARVAAASEAFAKAAYAEGFIDKAVKARRVRPIASPTRDEAHRAVDDLVASSTLTGAEKARVARRMKADLDRHAALHAQEAKGVKAKRAAAEDFWREALPGLRDDVAEEAASVATRARDAQGRFVKAPRAREEITQPGIGDVRPSARGMEEAPGASAKAPPKLGEGPGHSPEELFAALKEARETYGPDVTYVDAERLLRAKERTGLTKERALEAATLPRTLQTSFDLSGGLRQGLMVATRHPVIFGKDFFVALKALRKQGYGKIMAEIEGRDTFRAMQRAGLAISDVAGPLDKREEAIMSAWAQKLPGVGASSRTYSALLNRLRADVFDYLYEGAKKQGIADDPKLLQSLGRYINSATGRGHLGALENHAASLNAVFFSPRLLKSRLDFLNPQYYASLHPYVRRRALHSALQLAGTISGVLMLAKLAGADVEIDPRHSDFGKIRVGEKRIDIAGGFLPIIRLLAQVSTAQGFKVNGEPIDFGDYEGWSPEKVQAVARKQGWRFGRSKLSPLAALAVDWQTGSTFDWQPFAWKRAAYEQMLPLLAQDIWEMNQKEGLGPAALTGGLGFLGIPMSSYRDKDEDEDEDSLGPPRP